MSDFDSALFYVRWVDETRYGTHIPYKRDWHIYGEELVPLGATPVLSYFTNRKPSIIDPGCQLHG